MSEKKDGRGQEKIYQDLLQDLHNLNLRKVAKQKGLVVQENGDVVVESFARNYLVNKNGIVASDGLPATFGQKLAVISYLLSDSAGPPTFDFVPFSHLGGFNIGREQHANKNVKQPILDRFGDNADLLAKAALKIGGTQEESDTTGKHIWLFRAVPDLLIQIIFYEADEEFPADVQILFDSKALDLLGLTCLGFLPSYFVHSLIEAASDL